MAIFIGIFAFLYCAVYLVGIGAACLAILAVLGIFWFVDWLMERFKK